MEVFTPLNESKTKRLAFDRADVEVRSGDLDKRGYGWKARVKIDSKEYEVYGFSCSLPSCACDAYLKEVAA